MSSNFTPQAEQFSQEGEEGSLGGPGGDGLPLTARIPEQLRLVFAQRELLRLRAEGDAEVLDQQEADRAQ